MVVLFEGDREKREESIGGIPLSEARKEERKAGATSPASHHRGEHTCGVSEKGESLLGGK